MKPSLPSDVLLLAVTHEGRFLTKGAVGIVLAGALMCDEAVSRARWRSTGVDPDELVTLVLERAETAVDEVSRPLCQAGVLAPFERTTLGLFPRHGFVVRDQPARSQAEQRLRAAITLKASPDPGTAALAVLCAVSGIARALVPRPPRRDEWMALYAHLDRLRADLPPEVTAVLEATQAVYRRSGDGDSGVVPPSERGGMYGDHFASWDAGTDSGADGGADGGSD